MKGNVKIFIGCVIFGIVFVFLYSIFRYSYIVNMNENYEIKEYTFSEKSIENPDKMKIHGQNASKLEIEGAINSSYEDKDRIIINGEDMTDVYKEIESIGKE